MENSMIWGLTIAGVLLALVIINLIFRQIKIRARRKLAWHLLVSKDLKIFKSLYRKTLYEKELLLSDIPMHQAACQAVKYYGRDNCTSPEDISKDWQILPMPYRPYFIQGVMDSDLKKLAKSFAAQPEYLDAVIMQQIRQNAYYVLYDEFIDLVRQEIQQKITAANADEKIKLEYLSTKIRKHGK